MTSQRKRDRGSAFPLADNASSIGATTETQRKWKERRQRGVTDNELPQNRIALPEATEATHVIVEHFPVEQYSNSRTVTRTVTGMKGVCGSDNISSRVATTNLLVDNKFISAGYANRSAARARERAQFQSRSEIKINLRACAFCKYDI